MLLATHPDDCAVVEKILKRENSGSLHPLCKMLAKIEK
jgi:hypothetical protein